MLVRHEDWAERDGLGEIERELETLQTAEMASRRRRVFRLRTVNDCGIGGRLYDYLRLTYRGSRSQ